MREDRVVVAEAPAASARGPGCKSQPSLIESRDVDWGGGGGWGWGGGEGGERFFFFFVDGCYPA